MNCESLHHLLHHPASLLVRFPPPRLPSQAKRFYVSGRGNSLERVDEADAEVAGAKGKTYRVGLAAGEHNNGRLRRLLMKGFAGSGCVLSCELATISIGVASAEAGAGPATTASSVADAGPAVASGKAVAAEPWIAKSPARLAASGSLARAAMSAAAAAAEGAPVIETLRDASPNLSLGKAASDAEEDTDADAHEVVLVEYEDLVGAGPEALHENLVRYFFQAVDPTQTARAASGGAGGGGECEGEGEGEGEGESGSEAPLSPPRDDAATPPLSHIAVGALSAEEQEDGPPRLVKSSNDGGASTPTRSGRGGVAPPAGFGVFAIFCFDDLQHRVATRVWEDVRALVSAELLTEYMRGSVLQSKLVRVSDERPVAGERLSLGTTPVVVGVRAEGAGAVVQEAEGEATEEEEREGEVEALLFQRWPSVRE